jgi:hypothetical protein
VSKLRGLDQQGKSKPALIQKEHPQPPLSASPRAAANLSLSSAVGFPVGTYRVR